MGLDINKLISTAKDIKEAKNTIKQIKKRNKYFGKTFKRLITRSNFFGYAHGPKSEPEMIKDLDLDFKSKMNCGMSFEEEKFVIYGTSQDDYVFDKNDIANSFYVGTIAEKELFTLTFKDEKLAEVYILPKKVSSFKKLLGID